jgi:hypothetical protein
MREVTYTVHRLALGGWIATVCEAGDQPRPIGVNSRPKHRPERRAPKRIEGDELSAAAGVVEKMFIDMRTRELQRREGSLVARRSLTDSHLPSISHHFAAERLQSMLKGQATSFSETFLRRWFRRQASSGRQKGQMRPQSGHLTNVQPN